MVNVIHEDGNSCRIDRYWSILKKYEVNLKKESRKLKGSIYTPKFIVDYINKRVIIDNINLTEKTNVRNIKIIDPACGCGAFLIDALFKLKKITGASLKELVENSIYGVDIDPLAVEKTKFILSSIVFEFEGEFPKKFNIYCGNSLDKRFLKKKINKNFDAIVGNPPYVRIQNLDEDMKNTIKDWSFVIGDSDLYIPFMELGLKLLSKNGKMGYITPNSYFTSKAGRELRRFLQENKLIEEIVDFGHYQVFEGITTYTSITIISNSPKDFFIFKKVEHKEDIKKLDEIKGYKIYFNKINPEKWVLLDGEDWDIINHIENSYYKLKDIADIRVGIATLADRIYILEDPKEKGDYYIKEINGQEFLIEKEITREIIKVSRIKSEDDIKHNRRRIIFPYKKVDGKYVIIKEDELKIKYPKTYEYFLHFKDILLKRDKGKKKYEEWYAYGRTQGINSSFGKKILVPPMATKPTFIVCEKEDALFYSGYAIFPKLEPFTDLYLLKKILNSELMKIYINKTSKTYRGGWKSYAKTFIQDFGIPKLSQDEIKYLKEENDPKKINEFLKRVYYGRKNPLQ